jgi:hypothetical protein
MIRVSDYSTETGLRVRLECDSTSTVMQAPADDWHELVRDIKAGRYDGIATQPNIPFKH